MSAYDWNSEQAAGEQSLRKPNVNPHERALMALRIIRTWAEFDLKNSECKSALNPRHVLDLCEKAIEAARQQKAGGE